MRRGRGGLKRSARGSLQWIAMVGAGLLLPVHAMAHEPLWGETATIFGPMVYHPEIRVGYLRPGMGGELWQEYGLQYGINRFVNARLTIPVAHNEVNDTSVNGLGDVLLEAKYRFFLRQDTGLQASQTLVAGWKLPTGDSERSDPGGARLNPSDQAGSGRHGVEVGWAGDIERLQDTVWGSLFYSHEFGDGFRRGDTIALDVAYGYWSVRPNTGTDLGVMLAWGVHAEDVRSDRLDGDVSAENAYRIAGIQFTPIVTRGRAQYRAGVFVPLARSGDEERNDYSYEVRVGWEMFF